MLGSQILLQWAEQEKTQQFNCLSVAVKSQAVAQCPWPSMAGRAGRAVSAELLLPYCPGSKQMPFTALSALTIVSCQLTVALEILHNGRRGSGKGAAPAAPGRGFEVPYSALMFLPITE